MFVLITHIFVPSSPIPPQIYTPPTLPKLNHLLEPKADRNHNVRRDQQTSLQPITLSVRHAVGDDNHGEDVQHDLEGREVQGHVDVGHPAEDDDEGHDEE